MLRRQDLLLAADEADHVTELIVGVGDAGTTFNIVGDYTKRGISALLDLKCLRADSFELRMKDIVLIDKIFASNPKGK